jgi:hypothetical protein
MNRRSHPHLPTHRRAGFTTPIVAVALVVAMCGLALMLDRLWLDAADLELTTTAEAAALAAASELASDDLLRPQADPQQRLDAARAAAQQIAAQNVVAGSPVVLDVSPQGDVRFGQLVAAQTNGQSGTTPTSGQLVTDPTNGPLAIDPTNGQVIPGPSSGPLQFQETTTNPTTVVVTASRTRASSNPVGLFVGGLTGQLFGDVVSRVEATIDNRIQGVRPLNGAPVPALPLAIWLQDPAGVRLDTWQQQIVLAGGGDNYGYDSVGHRVYSGSDGIPEMVLHSQGQNQQPGIANMMVLDLGTGLNNQELNRQFLSGWTTTDLGNYGGEFRLSTMISQTLQASAQLLNDDRVALDTLIGEPRICPLYSLALPGGSGNLMQTNCVGLVAIRVLAVNDQSDGSCAVTVQPCVLATRTALLDQVTPDPSTSTTSTVVVQPIGSTESGSTGISSTSSTTTTATVSPPNPYIYKLQLTQ